MPVLTRPKPKPISSKKRTKVTGHLSGPVDQLTPIYNALLNSPDCIEVHYQPATRGNVEETTWTLMVEMRPVKRRAERQERPFEDKSGYVYFFRSHKTPGRFKIGTSIHTQQRIGEVNRKFDEDFERIHSVYSDDAYALEQALHKKYAAVLEPGTTEFFRLTDTHLEEIYAL